MTNQDDAIRAGCRAATKALGARPRACGYPECECSFADGAMAVIASLRAQPASQDAIERAKAAVKLFCGYEPGPRWATLVQDIASAITAAEAAARAEEREACAQVAFAVADDKLPEQGWDLARERRGLWASACSRVMSRIRARSTQP